MNPKSAKSKGKRFENYINNEIEKQGFGKAVRTPGSGSGRIKGDSFNSLEFLLEIKNQKRLNWWDVIDQSKRQAEEGNFDLNKWMLVVRDPRTPEDNPEVYAVVDFWEILELIKKSSEPRIKEPDREMFYKLKRLVNYTKSVIKELENATR